MTRPNQPQPVQLKTTMEQSDQPNHINMTDSGNVSSEGHGTLTERFLNLSQNHIKLKIQTEQLRYEIEFIVSLIHRMEPSGDQLAKVVAKRLTDALHKFKVEESREVIDVRISAIAGDSKPDDNPAASLVNETHDLQQQTTADALAPPKDKIVPAAKAENRGNLDLLYLIERNSHSQPKPPSTI